MKIIQGGVTAAKGFQATGAAAEIKYKGRTDMAMVYSEVPCVAAGTFTTNVVKAAPVKWDQNVVYNHPSAQAVICNSGIANACTGAEGYGYCKATADAASEILGIPADSVLVASKSVPEVGYVHDTPEVYKLPMVRMSWMTDEIPNVRV